MSDFFTKQNKTEHGPGPTEEIEWLVVQEPKDINGITQCATVRAKTAYFALREAEKLIENINKQDCICFPNPSLRIKGVK